MKKIFKEYGVYLGIVLLLVIFGLLLWWPQNTEEEPPLVETTSMTQITGLRQRSEGIDWGEMEIEVPKKMSILSSKSGFINGDRLATLLKALGMEGVGATKSDSFYVIYENENAVLYVKLKERQIDYQIKRKLSYLGNKDKTIAQENFIELMSKISSRKIDYPEVEYFKDEFRAVRSVIFDADYMELSANYLYNNYPVMSYRGGPSIKAQYGFDGELGRLIIFNPFDDLASDKEVEVIGAESIKQMPAEELPIFSILGNRAFTMSTGEELISLIKGGSSRVVYVFDPGTTKYLPYLSVKGKSRLESGDTEIIFGVPLAKQ